MGGGGGCDDRFAICQQPSRKTIQPSAGASKEESYVEEKWKMEEGDDYGAQSERRDWFIVKRDRGKWTIFQWIDGERERKREGGIRWKNGIFS